MSLLVWLPLIKNLNNQGLGTITTSGTPTFSDGGKIGKCLSNGDITISLPSIANSRTWSVCFWGYVISSSITTNWTKIAQIGDAASNLRIEVCPSSYSNGNYCYSTHNNSSYAICTGGMKAPNGGFYDQWLHFTLTSDGTTIRGYYNGQLNSSWEYNGTGAINGTFTLNNCSLIKKNDFRVYNHCLSAKEVKEISKALVVHYPLSNSGDGGDNILAGTVQNETTYAYPTSSFSDKWSKKTSIVPSASTYTLSFYAKSTVNGDKVRSHYYNPNTTVRCESSQGVVNTASDGNMTFTLSTDWKKYWVTYAQNATTATKSIIFPRMGSVADQPSMSGTGTVYIKNVKFEEGPKATIWKPNSADAAYNRLGYNSTIEYDTSGNCYNGTKSGTLTYSTDTIRNSLCTTFASGSHISTTIAPTGYTNSYTFSWWGKYTNYSGHMMWGFSNGNRLNLYMSSGNFYWNTGDGSNNPFNVSAATYGDGSWHHFAISGDGTTTKLYIDGEFKANAKTYKGITGTSLYFNGWDSGTSYNFNGSLSDFRLYSTVLSADDIKELYNSVAHIDKNGNIYGYEFNEV